MRKTTCRMKSTRNRVANVMTVAAARASNSRGPTKTIQAFLSVRENAVALSLHDVPNLGQLLPALLALPLQHPARILGWQRADLGELRELIRG
ncbi:hypothetical protein QFZ94_000695 [Paraburkholderia sp. JPY465]